MRAHGPPIAAGSRGRFLWLTIFAAAGVVAVNAAGIWGIALARRGVLDEADRVFRLEVSSRARSLESLLSSTRADLAFLAGSPVFHGLEEALGSTDPREARWRRLGAEGAILLFLRGHPEIAHLRVISNRDVALVEAGRRGGVPVLWVTSKQESPSASAESASTARAARQGGFLTGRFAFDPGPAPGRSGVGLEANLDAGALAAPLLRGSPAAGAAAECMIFDADGALIAGESGSKSVPAGSNGSLQEAATSPGAPAGTIPGPRASPAAPAASEATAGSRTGPFAAESSLSAAGWTARSPWRLRCVRTSEPAAALLDPLSSRYRLTLILNLAVMGLALLLGSFAIQQARRRESLEARAQEEMKVRELERRLFHAERLSTVGRLAAGIAHEINNPLEGIANYLGLAREAIARGDLAGAEKRLEGVREGLDRAAGIVRQVLAHADPATTPRSLIALNPILAQAVEFVRTRREFGKIRFDLDLAEGPVRLLGNPTTLGQLFLNLILNACEAQPRGGEVSIRSRRDGGRVLAEIADRGPGIPREDLPRILEPFFSTKESSGLGLSICWSIVQSHQGAMNVEERSGGGTVFRIEFPAGEAADA